MFFQHPVTIREEYIYIFTPYRKELTEICERDMDKYEKPIELGYQALESPMHSVMLLSHQCFWQVIMKVHYTYLILEIAESCSEAAECFFNSEELVKQILIRLHEPLHVIASAQKFPKAAKCLLQNQALVSMVDKRLDQKGIDVKWREKIERIANLEEKPHLMGVVIRSIKHYWPRPSIEVIPGR